MDIWDHFLGLLENHLSILKNENCEYTYIYIRYIYYYLIINIFIIIIIIISFILIYQAYLITYLIELFILT